MSIAFDDDDEIVVPPQSASLVPGRVKLEIINNNFEAPLEKNNQKVMLQLTARDPTASRAGLDLVAVLDVSGSMEGDKFGKMRTAMQFVIKKLGPIDRLSIVTFSSFARRRCPLRQITDGSQADMKKIINGLKARGNTNIGDGLMTGLKVIAQRKFTAGRAVGIMLMSDGLETKGSDVANVAVGDVPVHTFGFGTDHDPTPLSAVAKNSMDGTFSAVSDVDTGLSLAFSQCLAGLLTVVVQDLELRLDSLESTVIEEVTTGGYAQTRDDDEPPSLTVSFGDLYGREVRKVIVDLALAQVDQEVRDQEVLTASFSYTISGKISDGNPQPVLAERTSRASSKPVSAELETEEARLTIAKRIGEAMSMADEDELEQASLKLVEAQNGLEDLVQNSNTLVKMLKTELQQLLDRMASGDLYKTEGRAYAQSALTSHDRQRFAARGDVEAMRLFATPRMDKYLQQAKVFDMDPVVAPPSADEDTKEEIAANPLGPVTGPIAFYIKIAITALQAIGRLVNA